MGLRMMHNLAPRSEHDELFEGVRVFGGVDDAIFDRLALSAGSEIVDNQAYERNSRIPRKPWRRLALPEVTTIHGGKTPFTTGRSVALVRVPEELAADIRNAKLFGGLDRIVPQLQRFAAALNADPRVEARLLGANSRETELATSTFDPRSSRFIGLHVDSFYGAPVAARDLSPNRLCLNAGEEERYLLFINLTLGQMRDMLFKAGISDPRGRNDNLDIGELFMENFPRYPVVRLTIRPGEAYIAPTENVVHDSTTEGKARPDITITLLGSFAPA